jgi:hypothetical protein
MNFNIGTGHDNEYELFRSQTQEIISLYGIYIKYLIVNKINKDIIFGEHSHIKVDNEQVHEMYMLPEETETWSGGGDLFSKFGLQNLDTLNFFIGVEDMEKIHPNIVNREGKGWDFIIGNLIVLPNNKIMEVTNFEPEVEGNNNLFPYDLKKNVYKITCKSYIANRDDYSKADDISDSTEFDYEDFGNLESIFSDEEEKTEQITTSSEAPILADEVIYPNTVRQKPIRSKSDENNPFGDFG